MAQKLGNTKTIMTKLVFMYLIKKENVFIDQGINRDRQLISLPTVLFTFIVLLLSSSSSILKSQEHWTLTRCVDYALTNNIDLTLQNNQVKTQQINLSESKADLLPDLNMGSSVNMNFGRNIDPNTNAITFSQTMGNGYWISSSINIFQGMVKRNSIRFNNYLLSASREEA